MRGSGFVTTGKRLREECSAGVSPPPEALVGTNKRLEKTYVRPSSAPEASRVRPLTVLIDAFNHCLKKYAAKTAPLEFVGDQLKSIRQDLTIQMIEDVFAATVFETHARVCIALEHTAELGACLGNVANLHKKGIQGKRTIQEATGVLVPPSCCDCIEEFSCYRIVYRGLTSKHEDEVASEVAALSQTLPEELWTHEHIVFALEAVTLRNNAIVYMDHLRNAPTPLLKALLRTFVPKLRLEWLRSLVGGFNGFVPAAFIRKAMGVDTTGEAEALLTPVIGQGSWKDGMNCTSSRGAILRHLDELTAQRPDIR